MKKIIVAAGIAGALILLACAQGAEPNVTGTVAEKDIGYRKNRPSKGVSCYELEITDAQNEEHDFCVTKALFDAYNVGDKYPK